MGWARGYIEDLRAGKTVEFRPRGGSMTGLVESGDLVRVEPLDGRVLRKGDIVLCKVNGVEYLHKITATRDGRCQISNNHGRINGWTQIANVHGVCVAVNGRRIGKSIDDGSERVRTIPSGNIPITTSKPERQP